MKDWEGNIPYEQGLWKTQKKLEPVFIYLLIMSNPQFQSGKEKGILYSPLGHLEIPPQKRIQT